MEKLRNKKFDFASLEEVEQWRAEARALVEKYGWEDRVVTPYSVAVPVLEVIEYGGDISNCTKDSYHHVLQMLNGLVPILNHWEEAENTGVPIKNKITGKIFKVIPDIVEAYLECGMFEIAKEA